MLWVKTRATATASTDAVVFTRIILRSTSVHAFKRGDGTAGEQPSKHMKFYAKLNEDVELGVELNEEEVISLGAGFAEIFSNEDLTSSLMDTINKVVSEAKTQVVKPEKKDPEPEEDQGEDEDEVVGLVECYTYDHGPYGDKKYALVKSWLKTGEIEYEEERVYGDKRLYYKLTGSDLSALQKYLDDNEILSFRASI